MDITAASEALVVGEVVDCSTGAETDATVGAGLEEASETAELSAFAAEVDACVGEGLEDSATAGLALAAAADVDAWAGEEVSTTAEVCAFDVAAVVGSCEGDAAGEEVAACVSAWLVESTARPRRIRSVGGNEVDRPW